MTCVIVFIEDTRMLSCCARCVTHLLFLLTDLGLSKVGSRSSLCVLFQIALLEPIDLQHQEIHFQYDFLASYMCFLTSLGEGCSFGVAKPLSGM